MASAPVSDKRRKARYPGQGRDLLRGEVSATGTKSVFLGTGAVLGCNSAETDVSRQAGSTFESLTRWVPAGRGERVQNPAFLANPACETFKKVFYSRNLG